MISRYQIGVWMTPARGSGFPFATLLINVGGSLLLGFLMRYLAETGASRETRAMLTTGLCGGFTTFSTFSFETVELISQGRLATAASYASISVIASVIACYVGYLVADISTRR